MSDEVVELADDAIDTIEIADRAIDFGETAAETMPLALARLPRGPDAADAPRGKGVESEDDLRSFNALAGLRACLVGS